MSVVDAEIKRAIEASKDTIQLDVVTNALGGSATHEFTASADDAEVSAVALRPDVSLPIEAQIMLVRVIVNSGSTDSDFLIHEDDDRQDIDEVVRITGLSSSDDPQTFQPGGGVGVQFLNQNVPPDNQIYFTIIENSGAAASVYTIRIRFIDVLSPQ